MPRTLDEDVNDAFWASSEILESKKKNGRKVVDEEEKLRRKIELAELLAEEERITSGLEEVYLQKVEKVPVCTAEGGKLSSPFAKSFLDKEKETLQNRRTRRNQKKSKKKKAQDEAEQIKAAAEAADQRRTKVVKAALEENVNHAIFFKRSSDHANVEDEGGNDTEQEEEAGLSDTEEDFVVVDDFAGSPTSVAVEVCDFVPEIDLDATVEPHSYGRRKSDKNQGKLGKKERRVKNGVFDVPMDSAASTTALSKKQAKAAAKARYDAFEKRVLPELVAAQPLLKLKQHRENARALWLRSPENPDHPNHKLFLAHSELQA